MTSAIPVQGSTIYLSAAPVSQRSWVQIMNVQTFFVYELKMLCFDSVKVRLPVLLRTTKL